MGVVLGEVAGNADQARGAPIGRLCLFGAKALQNKPFEIAAMVHEPIEIEQSLVDDVLVARPLVLDDDW